MWKAWGSEPKLDVACEIKSEDSIGLHLSSGNYRVAII